MGCAGRGVCPYDTIGFMGPELGLAAALCALPAILCAQTDEPVAVFTEHPRLFLRPQRLRLLKRERERSSAALATVRERWWPARRPCRNPVSPGPSTIRSPATPLTAGKLSNSPYPRPPTLASRPSSSTGARTLLTEPQSGDLAARLSRFLAEPPGNETVARVRARACWPPSPLDHVPKPRSSELDRVVRQWWMVRHRARSKPAARDRRATTPIRCGN